MKKFKVRIAKDNISSEIILIAEKENQIRQFIKFMSNNLIDDSHISFPSFTAKDLEDFKKLIQ